VIQPGAFRKALENDDVIFNINHGDMPLSRTRSGTLVLKEDNRGLYMETSLDPEDPDVKSIVYKMKRGDLDKMSFAFRADVEEWDDTGDIPKRTIKEVRLVDVSIVTFPAYDGTEIGLRSLEESRKNNHSGTASRVRMKMKLALRANAI
jgi:HK97 family phage prohead protease